MTAEQMAMWQSAMNSMNNTANIVAQGRTNKQTRQWNEKMYAMQRQHALQDWNMQNEYNSPQAQMKRFSDAGLNTNLIYGQGTDSKSGPVRQANMESWRPTAPQIDIGSMGNALMSYYDVKIKEAQVDNLKTQNTVMVQDAALKAAQVIATSQGTETSKFNLEQANRLKDVSAELATEQVRKLKADIDYTLNNDERQKALTANSLAQGAEQILNSRSQRASNDAQRAQIREQIINLQKDAKLKQLDIELKQKGIMPGDPLYMRVLGRIVGDPEKIIEKVKEVGKKIITGPPTTEEWLKNNKAYQERLKNRKK